MRLLGPDGTATLLAVDTSTDMLCCAVCRLSGESGPAGAGRTKVEVLAALDHPCHRRSNVELASCCEEAVARAGLSMGELTGIVCGRGPGSFTGVRIGVACAKGLACGLGLPLFGASTLDADAWSAWRGGVRGLVGVVGDAMRGEVYPGVYLLDDSGARRLFGSETVLKADACVREWSARSDAAELTLTGDGLRKYRDRFEAAGLVRIASEGMWFPSAEGLVRALAQAADEGVEQAGDPALVLPIYTRLSDAEENERKRLGLGEPASAGITGTADALADRHLQLRPMSVNDVEQAAALERVAYEGAAHTPWSARLIYEDLTQPGRSWWVAHDMGTLIGFAGGMMAGDDFEVLDVVVDPDRRREGIGRRLVRRIAYDAQMLNAQAISLEVEDANLAGQALYRSLGLEVGGRRPGYYGAGHDALIMRAPLPLAEPTGEQDSFPGPRPSIRTWPIDPGTRSAGCERAIAQAGSLLLAVESSCDETAMAVIDGSGRILSSVVATQIDFHARFGGVVPEIASRKHVEAIVGVYEEAMAQAGEALGCATLVPSDLAGVGVTYGPGLVGALVVGVAFAKGLCAACGIPLVGVNHLEGHLMANLFETPDLTPPFVASLVSGGNTMLVLVRGWGDYQVLGQTIDDAVGEAFDKVAKALGLGYPGGPVISELARTGNPKAIRFPRALMHGHGYDFSLSGLKTSVITYIEGENKAGRPIDLPDLAASFEAAVIDVQVSKAIAAVEDCGVGDFCVGGGVAANPQLRAAYQREFGRRGVRVTVPPLSACTDNAQMIALVARRRFDAGERAPLTLDADPNLRLPHAE